MNVDEGWRLSPTQEGIWSLEQITPGVFNVPVVATIRGDVDVEILRRAIAALRARHRVLRQGVGVSGGFPLGRIAADGEPVAVRDVPASVARQQMVKDAHTPFDLARDPLCRFTVFRVDESTTLLFIKAHHLVFDARSMEILGLELSELYSAIKEHRQPRLPELALQYPDFADMVHGRVRQGAYDRHLRYWAGRLSDAPIGVALGSARERESHGVNGRVVAAELPGELWSSVKEVATTMNVSPFMLGLVAWAAALSFRGGQKDLLIGAPVEARRLEVMDNIGPFANTVGLRLLIDDGESVGELVGKARSEVLGALENQYVPFEVVLRSLPAADAGEGPPRLATMFSLEDETRVELVLDERYRCAEIEEVFNGYAKFRVSCQVCILAHRILVKIEFDEDAVPAAVAGELLEGFLWSLRKVVREPGESLGSIRRRYHSRRVRGLTRTDHERPAARAASAGELTCHAGCPALLHHILEHQAQIRPDGVAVLSGDLRVTYAELNHAANVLASRLARAGAGAGTVVAVAVDSGRISWAVSMLALFKLGAVYVPVSPRDPEIRGRTILDDCGADFLLVEDDDNDSAEGSGLATLVVGSWADLVAASQVEGADLKQTIAESNVCSVLYTSGSTGQPKGVIITHDNLVAFTRAAADAFGLGEADRFLQVAPSTFDVQFEELFPVWFAGGAVVFDGVSLRDTTPAELLGQLARRGVTAVELPTAYWKELSSVIGQPDVEVPDSLRRVVLGGERVSTAYVDRWSGTGVELYNVYGLTECAITSLCHRCGDESVEDIPIGVPLAHADIWVVDPDGNVRTAPGSVGEILVGGPGVALGYVNDPRRTADAFIPDSYSGRVGARVYQTGDLGLLLEGGEIAFVGRRDEQLSVRGHRVEPREVEAAIEAHPAVRQAAVVPDDEAAPQRLTAFVTGPVGGHEVDMATFVEERLPTYMVPARFVHMEELPITPHGKVDRSALLRMAKQDSGPDARPASRLVGDVERRIAALWSDVLGGGPFDRNDSFFEMGGNSLTAIAMVTRFQQEFGVEIPIRQLYSRHTTIRRLGSLVSEHQNAVT